jgi:outer membrane protein OmpA-like peptidoglycan-associated protein
MKERNAVIDLLAGVNELLKTVRPIDQVHIVVFDDNKKVEMGGRKLRVQTFKSSQAAELRAFVDKVYGDDMLTAKTVLYEAMLAGLDLIGKMPDSEPRFMVVFTDGEDINSDFKKEDVLKVAQGLDKFNAYAIDYMPGKEKNKFLTSFATQSSGQIWKAESETNLVSIFQSVASKMEYYYVISYQFPPTGTMAVSPASLTIDEVISAAPERKIDAAVLTLRPTVDSAYGIARWKAVASNSRGTVAELAGEGAPAAELKLPLPTSDLISLAAGGDLAVKLELQDKNGQDLLLTAPPVKFKVVQTQAKLAVEPAILNIEEIKTIDSSPMLGQVYFAQGSSEIPAQYVRFTASGETAGFDEQKFKDTLEKYYQLLNIVGKRMVDNTAATITLVGCNDNTGAERGKKKLSGQRAEAVKNYLQTVWGIAPERMTIEARNLPKVASSTKSKEGQAENRRVEIIATEPKILAPIRSTYLTTRIDASTLTLRPEVTAPYGIADWKISASNAAGSVADLAGKDAPAKETKIALDGKDLRALATAGDITVKMEMQDKKGQKIVLSPAAVKVNFVETRKRIAEKLDQKVQEKYALILFDFDKDTISATNQELVNRIVDRFKTLPQATMSIVGHTDNIGKEAYNVKLSERRAAAVNKMVASAYGENAGDRIRFSGVGPASPLFDNQSPEGRSFNRTVTITLEYLSAE